MQTHDRLVRSQKQVIETSCCSITRSDGALASLPYRAPLSWRESRCRPAARTLRRPRAGHPPAGCPPPAGWLVRVEREEDHATRRIARVLGGAIWLSPAVLAANGLAVVRAWMMVEALALLLTR